MQLIFLGNWNWCSFYFGNALQSLNFSFDGFIGWIFLLQSVAILDIFMFVEAEALFFV
jgi:hypothetical protein